MGATLSALIFGLSLILAAAIGLRAGRLAMLSDCRARLGGALTCMFAAALGFFMPHFVGNALGLAAGLSNCLPVVLALQLATLAAIWRAPRLAPGAHTPWRWRENRLPLAITAFYVLMGAVALVQRPQGFEARAYHLPAAVNFLQTGNLLPWETTFPHHLPANTSLMFAAVMAWLPEHMVAIVNLGFVAMLALAAAHLARVIGADNWAARWSAAAVVTTPMVIFGAVEANADLGGCALLVLACGIALERPFRGQALLSGVALGLAFGFKSFHLLTAPLLTLTMAWQGQRTEGTTGERARAAIQGGALWVAGFCLAAGFWLGRNYVMFNNPLYPVAVPVIGKLLNWPSEPSLASALRLFTQAEWVNSSWQWLVYPWTESQQLGKAHKHSSGLGPFFAAIAIPAVALHLLLMAKRRANPKATALLLISAALFLAWWVLGDRQPRYALGEVLLVLILSATLITALQGKPRWTVNAVAVAATAYVLVESTITLGVGAASRLAVSGQWARADFYEYPALLDTQPAGTVVMNVGARPNHYGLFGAKLANQVVSVSRAREVLDLPRDPLKPIDEAVLTPQMLKDNRIGFVYTDRTPVKATGCPMLREVWRQHLNPGNRVPLEHDRVLYKVQDCQAGDSPR